MKIIRQSQVRAAAMAHATRGRKTRFRSRAEVLSRLSRAEALEEIEEAVTTRPRSEPCAK